MIVLGIDPSLARTGWAVVGKYDRLVELVHHGAIPTDSRDGRMRRLIVIMDSIRAVVRRHEPVVVAIEEGFSLHNKTTQALTEVRTVAMLAAWEVLGEYVSIVLLRPTQVKKAVTSSGKASKAEVAAAVQRILGLDAPLGEDESDAAAVALAAIRKEE